MKKLFIAFVCFTALVLAGCNPNSLNPSGGGGISGKGVDPTDYSTAEINKLDNKVEQCWCIRSVTTVYGEKTEAEEYVWCTEREVAEQCLEAIEITEKTYKQYGITAQVEFRYYEVDAKTKAACDKMNKGTTPGGGGTGGEKACYFFVSFRANTNPESKDIRPYTSTQGHVWCTEDELADLIAWQEAQGEDAYAWKTSEPDQESCEKSKDIPAEALEVMHRYGF